MVILTNCLTERADEGTRKVVRSLITRIKDRCPDTKIATYESGEGLGDRHFRLNKLLVSRSLSRYLHREPVLYMPSPAKSLPLALRLWILSCSAKKGLSVLISMQFPVDRVSRFFMNRSKARILTLSQSACAYYRGCLSCSVEQLPAGVDTEKFQPATAEEKLQLRRKYRLDEKKPVVLHVGHLKPGRNVAQLLKLDSRFHAVLAVSTQTAQEQDRKLRQQLLQRQELTLIDSYLPHIEELYRLADVYLFPVEDPESCICLPLSVLEAAACGIPVVTTPFGQLQELVDRDGFYELKSFEPAALNAQLEQAMAEKKDPRPAVLEYDWSLAVDTLLKATKEGR